MPTSTVEKLKRSAHLFYIDTTFGGSTPSWYLVGKDVEDMSIELILLSLHSLSSYHSQAVLPPEYLVEKILTILGDGDKAPEVIAQTNAERLDTLTNAYKGKSIPEEENGAQRRTEGE